MFHVELAPLGGILGPLKSDLGVFWPFWGTDFIMYKHKKTFYPLRYLAPDFKTYISGIVLQFPTIWLEKNDGYFFLLDGSSGPMWPKCFGTPAWYRPIFQTVHSTLLNWFMSLYRFKRLSRTLLQNLGQSWPQMMFMHTIWRTKLWKRDEIKNPVEIEIHPPKHSQKCSGVIKYSRSIEYSHPLFPC